MLARNRTLTWAVGAAAIMLIGGCRVETVRTVSTGGAVASCSPGNIYDAGYDAGLKGFPLDQGRRFGRCAPNRRAQAAEAYRSGWDAGIALYCTEENGFVVAANGVENPKTCPRSLSDDHKRGRRVGADVFKENQSIAERSEKIRVLDANIRSGRYSPDQLERLLRDRRELIERLEKDQRQLTKALNTARKRGYPVQ